MHQLWVCVAANLFELMAPPRVEGTVEHRAFTWLRYSVLCPESSLCSVIRHPARRIAALPKKLSGRGDHHAAYKKISDQLEILNKLCSFG